MAVTNNFPNALSLKQALGTGSGDITGGWYRPEWLSALIDFLIEKAMSAASGLLKMIPIFGQIYGSLAKLNSATLNLALMPTFALEFLMEIKEIVMDGFFHLHSVDSLEFEVGWHIDRGPFQIMKRGDDPSRNWQIPSRLDIPMLFGISVCYGLKLTMFQAGESITSLEACPELRLGVQFSLMSSEAAEVSAFLAPPHDPDRKICVSSMFFWTDGDADTFRDEPYLFVCMAGHCKQTRRTTFQSNHARCPCGSNRCRSDQSRYTWCKTSRDCSGSEYFPSLPTLSYPFYTSSYYWNVCTSRAKFDDELCFDVTAADLKKYPLRITPFDYDWPDDDDPYANAFEIDVSALAESYGSNRYQESSSRPLLGHYAHMDFTVEVLHSRHLKDVPSPSALKSQTRRVSPECSAGKVDLGVGIHFIWGGSLPESIKLNQSF